MLVAFVCAPLMSMLAVAQHNTTPDTEQPTTAMTEKIMTEKMTTKAVALSGKVSDDGKTFVSDKDAKSWTVSNPEALKGHEGYEVMLKAHVDTAKTEIHIVSVKMGKGEKKATIKKD
jgi:hypothetical protein